MPDQKYEDRVQEQARQAFATVAMKMLAEEGITQAILDAVDLDIAYSPVLTRCGESLAHAAEAIPTQGGQRFIVRYPGGGEESVDRDSLKVMRARYLLRHGEHMQQQMRNLPGPLGDLFRRGR